MKKTTKRMPMVTWRIIEILAIWGFIDILVNLLNLV